MSLRRAYGAGPLHLLASLASLALAAYAFGRVFAGSHATNVVMWFVGALVVHDLVAFPLYTALDRLARGRRTRGVNYVRVPALLGGLAFVVFAPLILGLGGGRYERATTLSQGVYLGRWLLLCGALCAGSALVYAVRSRRGCG
jgi:fumarate reductase subunit D